MNSRAITETILDIEGVTVSFDGFKAIDGLDFRLQQGEVRFLIGPNGAGKTTLLDIITGKTKPIAGKIVFDGKHDLRRWPEYARVRHGIGRKFQTPTIFSSLSVWENMEAAIGMNDTPLGLLRKMTSTETDRVQSTLKTIGLDRRAQERAGTLAHGQKQWLEIGMLLIQEPKLLLLDEPVAGMTRRDRDLTGELIVEIARTRSVLVVEHDMDFVRKFAHWVTVLHTGKFLCEGTVEQVQNDPRVIEVYLGRTPEGVH